MNYTVVSTISLRVFFAFCCKNDNIKSMKKRKDGIYSFEEVKKIIALKIDESALQLRKELKKNWAKRMTSKVKVYA